MKNLSNISIPTQSTFDSSVDANFTKVQVVSNRLYSGSNKVGYKDEFSDAEETNPTYTYLAGNLSRIDYSSGNYKLFTYNISGDLIQLDFVKGASTYRKVFTYDLDSNLTSIAFSII